MKKTSVAELRKNLGPALDAVQNGEDLQIEKRNIPIARIIPIKSVKPNKTRLGLGKGTVKFLGDVTASIMDSDWEMKK